MATLVLTVAGGAIGGPIGAAIGATLGRTIDREVIFRPKGRDGPRLTDLAVQTSRYGAPIARLFGTMRVAGTVIWSTDLIESRSTSGGSKGSPSTTSYSYSASFAVLLSARKIVNIRRIWADGKLLRGSAGDFKSRIGGYRMHTGDADQLPDPLIASLEQSGECPAHRGCAYAVFEQLQLADFGNRIPSLTFEVEADADALDIATVADALSDGLVSGTTGVAIAGYSAYGDSRRALVEGLGEAGGAWFAPGEDGIEMRCGSGEATAITDAGAHAAGKATTRDARKLASADSVPGAVALSYYDAARDYQAGVQRATRTGEVASDVRRIDLPAVLNAGEAQQMAQAALARAEAERETRRVQMPWNAVSLLPGDRVTIAGETGIWRVGGWSLEAMALRLDLVRVTAMPAAVPASPGRVLPAPDIVQGATQLAAFEMPLLDDVLRSACRIGIAAAGDSSDWRSAALSLSEDGGTSWRDIGATAAHATMGLVTATPGAAPATIEDRRNAIEVELAHAGMFLTQADAASLDSGANLALLGDELLQFAKAEQIDDRRWRLSGLWRGRRGTEAAIGAQQPGDRFILIEPTTVAPVDCTTASPGSDVQIEASGIGDADHPAQAAPVVSGRSIVPPSPVHLRATPQADGTIRFEWTRRSRNGWRWINGIDAPLGEESERYRVECTDPGGSVTAIETGQPLWNFQTGAALAGTWQLDVRQIGSNGLSLPARIGFSI